MKTAALLVDAIRWVCHAVAAYTVLWVGGSTWPLPVAVVAICMTVAVDYAATRPLVVLSDWLTARTRV